LAYLSHCLNPVCLTCQHLQWEGVPGDPADPRGLSTSSSARHHPHPGVTHPPRGVKESDLADMTLTDGSPANYPECLVVQLEQDSPAGRFILCKSPGIL
ncbi:hypothetical protein ILYODFUR_038719, partial [Ilyodon furcidens]